ncbi:MAG TPA: hypothetical protein P5572_09810, partial [Phycisphaerae bacterium]|nr:hypothetical protein [Phycisphaerae bacterium]
MMEPAIVKESMAREEAEAAGTANGWAWAVGGLMVLLAGLVAFGWLARLAPADGLVDFRYAENLARGQGFVFNAGERVLGTASPLFAALLGLGGVVFGVDRVPLVAHVLGILCGAVAGGAVYGLLRSVRVGPAWSAASMLVVGLHPAILAATVGGEAIALGLALVAVGLVAVVRGWWIVAAVMAALLVPAQAWGLLWALLLVAAIVWGAGRRALGPLAVFAILLGAWLIFATVYFGSPVPLPLRAECAAQMHAGGWAGWLGVLRWYGGWLVDHLWMPHTYGHAALRWQVWAWIVLLVVGCLGIARRPRRLHGLILLPAAIAVYGVVLLWGVDLRAG